MVRSSRLLLGYGDFEMLIAHRSIVFMVFGRVTVMADMTGSPCPESAHVCLPELKPQSVPRPPTQGTGGDVAELRYDLADD